MGPRRPLPRSVYVRRRIVVAIVAVAILVIIIAIAWPRGSGTPAPTGSDPASTAPTDGETALGAGDSATSPSDAQGDACDPGKLELTANTDKSEYQQGESVQLTLTVTNNSSKDCVVAAGTDQQVFTIASPSGDSEEVYWTSTDCQTDATPQNVVLKAGVPVSSAVITWDRHRSKAGDCDPAAIAARPVVGSGGASFDLIVKLGDLTSQPKRFYLY